MINRLIPCVLFTLLMPVIPTVTHAAAATVVVVKPVLELDVGEPIIVNGIVRSRSDILLPSTVEGELVWVLEEGTRVEAGAIVAKVDDRQLLLQKQEQELLAERARINRDYLQREVNRLTQLEAANLASRTQLAEITSRRDLAANDVVVAQARLAQLDESLSRTRIVSPVQAVVAERRLQGGEFARRGEPVVRVVDTGSLEIQLTIPVAYMGRVDSGQAVSVSINQLQFTSSLRALVQASNPESQTIIGLADVPAEIAPRIASGQFAAVEVPLARDSRSLFVPRDAIVLRTGGSYVYRIDENNIANRVTVTLGTGQGDQVAVTGALSAGDRVAVRGVERLSDGQAVTLTQT